MGIKTDAQVYGTEQKLRNKLMHVWPIHIKGAKNTQLRKNSLIKKWYWENQTTIFKRMRLDKYFILHMKVTSQLINYFNVRYQITKHLGENAGNKLLELLVLIVFFFQKSDIKSRDTKAKIKQVKLHQTKNVLHSKTIDKMKMQPIEQNKILANHISDKELISKLCRELIKVNSKNQSSLEMSRETKQTLFPKDEQTNG